MARRDSEQGVIDGAEGASRRRNGTAGDNRARPRPGQLTPPAYFKRYGISTWPFQIVPSASLSIAAETQVLAVNKLQNLVMGKAAFGISYAPMGFGKSTGAKTLAEQLSAHGIPNVYLPGVPGGARQSEAGIYEAIRKEFELPRSRSGSAFDTYTTIFNFAKENDDLGSTTVVTIDEAQNLRSNGLNAVLHLLHMQNKASQLIQLILIGTPELMGMIEKRPALFTRLGEVAELKPFTCEEVGQMINFRLEKCGRFEPLFTPEAIKTLHHVSRGVPRDIIQIANKACIRGDERASAMVEEVDVDTAATDLRKEGTLLS